MMWIYVWDSTLALEQRENGCRARKNSEPDTAGKRRTSAGCRKADAPLLSGWAYGD